MARQYETVELCWNAPAPEGSHVYVDLKAEVTGPDGAKNVKGFYAGNDTYKLRFLPEQPGTYTWKVTGVITDEGTTKVEPAAEGHHGPVRAKGTALYYADGTDFHGFGTTVYALAHQSKELVDETIATLAANPFNKVRMCVFPKHYIYNFNDPDHYAFFPDADRPYVRPETMEVAGPSSKLTPETAPKWDVNHPDFDFWDAFEGRMKQLQDLGIEVDLILFHPYDRWGFSMMPLEDNLTYLDYLLRRLSAFPNVWWSLANEYDLCFAKKLEDWYAFEEKIAADDPVHHLMGNHNCFPIYDAGREHITHASVQGRTLNMVPELMKKYGKPVCFDECCYEGNLEQTWGCISGPEMTRRFWKVTATGGHCTHGETFLPGGDEVVWWARGGKLVGESPARIRFLRGIAESLPGALEPLGMGLGNMIEAIRNPEGKEQMLAMAPDSMRPFLENIMNMDVTELTRHMDQESDYAGHVGEEAYLFYLDNNCFGFYDAPLPEDGTYTVEVIDTWNMTRTVVATDAKGTKEHGEFMGRSAYRVNLPGKEWMAILATKNH